MPQSDAAPDMRCLALCLTLPGGGRHDLLLANFPTSLPRNAEQLFEITMSMLADGDAALAKLTDRLGIDESLRIIAYRKSAFRLCSSLAQEHFWSGCAYLWGAAPVRFELRPLARASAPSTSFGGDDALFFELADRLRSDDLHFRLAVQRFANESITPIEDASVDWPERDAPAIEIADLRIPRQALLGPSGESATREMETMAASRWNAPAAFRPLGSLNRLRRAIHQAMTAR